jgi:radical SAM superfamily enzyme YgiQ (UPF0313 family)
MSNSESGAKVMPASGNVAAAVSFPPLGPRIKVLMVWPRIPLSFWGFEGMMSLIPEQTIMPPLGLITVASLCPPQWEIRLLDRAFEDLRDADLLWADLVMVSAMHVQREDAHSTLSRARQLGRRTMIGGSYASTEPETLLPLADHVVVGEPDEIFGEIAAALEQGTALRLYRITDKPDISRTPVPRFDLLRRGKYASMSVQFSRGCPFQCEFCDIITIYGRRPRTKTPQQLIRELEALLHTGWRKEVFIVDDNFIGNHKLALELVRELETWQVQHNHPFIFYTEASLDLALRPELLNAMVRANFLYVFIGIETPVAQSLKEAKKFQNLRADALESIRFIQRRGLWVTGGFIVGFDSDGPDIFDRQIAFIEDAAIPWAMTGFLQAPPTTPLFDRMIRENRLIHDSQANTNFSLPNFRTLLPLPELLKGLEQMLKELYDSRKFYRRALHSLERWISRAHQHVHAPLGYRLRVIANSLWRQGVLSDYRAEYWGFLAQVLFRWGFNPPKLWLGFVLALSGNHFVPYAREVVKQLEEERLRYVTLALAAQSGSQVAPFTSEPAAKMGKIV